MSEENQLSTPSHDSHVTCHAPVTQCHAIETEKEKELTNPAKKGISIFPAGAPPDETTEITPTQIPAAIDAIMASGDEDRMSMKINRAEVYHGIPHWYKGAFVQIFELGGKYYAFAKNDRGLDLQTRGYDEYRTAMGMIYKMIEHMRKVIL